jgi:flagellar hook-length control protein FliK
MSALDGSPALNALNALKLKPPTPASGGVSATNPNRSPETKEETSKARFSRLLAHSQAASAAARLSSAPAARSALNPPVPSRTSRPEVRDTKENVDKTAEAVAPRTSAVPPRVGAAARSGTANDARDQTSETKAAAQAGDAGKRTEDGEHRLPSDAPASDLASPLPGAVLPAPSAQAQAGVATRDASSDPTWTAARLAAGTDASAKSAPGGQGANAEFASASNSASMADRGPGQASQVMSTADAKLASDATAASGAWPQAALASLAALSVGAGKTDERSSATTSTEGLPPGGGTTIAGQGLAHLARSIDSLTSATATVSTAVGDPGFHEALAAQVSVFAREGLSKAELHLNPAELGPVSVQITMNGDQARVDFGADRAQTRQVIEAGWAELAASLQDAGFTLSGGGVSEQAQRQASQRQAAPQNGRTDRSGVADDVPVASIVAARPRAGSALDLYA